MHVSRCLAIVLTTVLAAAGASCGPLDAGRDDGNLDPERFRTHIGDALGNGLTTYWLGRSFESNGALFDVIDPASDDGSDGATDWVELKYLTAENTELSTGQGGSLRIETFDRGLFTTESWERLRNPEQVTVLDRKTVPLGSFEAELLTTALDTPEPNQRLLIVEFEDEVVVASTSRFLAENGANVNPLMDEELFLEVLQDLRPYDE